MFRILGISVQRVWPLWLLGWLALLSALYLTAPPWQDVAQEREFSFLPESTPSRQAAALLAKAFPNDHRASNIVIVLRRTDKALQEADKSFIKDVVRPALLELADGKPDGRTSIIAGISTLHDPGVGGLLVSADKQATLVVVDLSTELLDGRNWPVVANVEKLMAQWQRQAPPGLDLTLTGSATVGRDMTMGQRASARATEFWTVALVIVLLCLIYRAPLLAFIPLLSVFLATQIALKLLSHLAQLGVVTLFEGVEIFITVILYGTGVDYCLFLIARYQEEYEHGADWGAALGAAISKVGPALAASACTVILGIGMMVFAQFGKFQSAGVAIAFSLVVGLSVVLTFTTSLLRLTGRGAFWPRTVAPVAAGAEAAPGWLAAWFSWEAFGQVLQRRPALIWLVAVLLLSPFVALAFTNAEHLDYDLVRRLPPDVPSVAGTKALEAHFPAGTSGIVTVLIHYPHGDFRTVDTKDEMSLGALTDRLTREHTKLQMADLRGLSQPLGFTIAARAALDIPLDQIPKAKQEALEYYVSTNGTLAGQVTRLEVTMLPNPLSRQGLAWLTQLEEAIRAELPSDWRDVTLHFVSSTADMRDLKQVTNRDQTTIQVLAAFSVLLILIVLLRRPLVALYLIVSVLFSYFATLGATFAFFQALDPEGFAGLDWKVPIFLFTILVAVGADYNIFLMTRVAEEQQTHGPVQGIHVALVKTGRIITSCGIIMAGTFSALLAGTMQDLLHLGFAFVCGILLDTFIVRPILVPTFLIVFERGRVLWHKLNVVVEKTAEPEVKGPR